MPAADGQRWRRQCTARGGELGGKRKSRFAHRIHPDERGDANREVSVACREGEHVPRSGRLQAWCRTSSNASRWLRVIERKDEQAV